MWGRQRVFALVGALAVATGATFVAPSLAAEWTDKVSIHAYGGWALGSSDPYPYLSGSGDSDPEVDNVEAVLLFQFRPTENVQIVLAPGWEIAQSGESAEQSQSLEIASVEWSSSEKLRLRLGRNRLPFGIYTDIFDVGTLRPLYFLPQSIYGPTGFVNEAYNGAGISGLAPFAGGWQVDYDLFAGGTDFETEEIFEVPASGSDGGEAQSAEAGVEKLFGGRLTLTSPIDGLSFGASAFSGQPQARGNTALRNPSWGDFSSYGAHLEFLRGPWNLRTEVGRHYEDEYSSKAGYVEISRRIGTHWQGALRGESVRVDFDQELPPDAKSLLDHDELVAGISYWLSENLVLRLAYHRIEGNLFAHPSEEELADVLAAGKLDETSRLITFGAQFSF